ncbi:MAG: hypothetical protein NZZ41_04055 [Candidatus Dojkabacteria bacterium]|nr:hypothetical protein [Candidatus Dojkabacteria bacterium]
MSEIINLFKNKLLEKVNIQKISSSGWYIFNAVCCPYHGNERPDRRKRGNFYFTENSWVYNCFNCGFKTVFSENNLVLTERNKKLLEWMGFSQEEINEISFSLLKRKNLEQKNSNNPKDEYFNFFDYIKTLNPTEKEEEMVSIEEYLDRQDYKENKNFMKILDYLFSRGSYIVDCLDKIYWVESSPDMIVLPIFIKNKIYGYIMRNLNKSIKYMNIFFDNKNLLYNLDSAFKNRKYIILVEGPFDALSIDGISIMKNTINNNIIKMLKSFNKEIIILPDKDISGLKVIEKALEHNLRVSFPFFDYWDEKIKDASDAAKKYGKFYTLNSIIRSSTDDPLKIKTLTNLLKNEMISNLED